MRPQGTTFWHLDGSIGWHSSITAGVAENLEYLCLEAHSEGPLTLVDPTGSLSRLTLPQGFALDAEGIVYLLTPAKPWRIKRFDVDTQTFIKLPTIGGVGTEARQFQKPENITAAGANLYVADTGNQRVQVFDINTLALLNVWRFYDWLPVDVAARSGKAYILDRPNGRVYIHIPGIDYLQCIVDEADAGHRWTRVVVDREEHIYLLDPKQPALDIYDPAGNYLETVQDASDVRSRFDVPAIVLLLEDGSDGFFCLPASLQRLCDRHVPEPPAPVAFSLVACPPWSDEGLIFDRRGQLYPPIDPAAFRLSRLYKDTGVWISQPLDSDIYQCQWHRVAIEISELPPGSNITISAFTSENEMALATYDQLPDTQLLSDKELWKKRHVITGPMQSPRDKIPKPVWNECLVQSDEGQYLWLKLELKSDGYVSPAISGIRVYYPRDSYSEYLPAVFSSDDESKRFLERYLSIAQTTWDDLEDKIETISQYFDPHTVPEGEFLEYLAGWLALPLEGSWNGSQKRRLLEATPEIYPRRGTLVGLRQYLRVYLQNMIGLGFETVSEFYPQIIEGYRLRQYLMLNKDRLATLGHNAPLWSLHIVGRLQLGVFATEGKVRLVSTGEPERNLFHEFSHRFQVFVPSSWIKTADDEAMLRRAIDSEKPAHTDYQLCLVEPRLQIGYQSTVGVDTIIAPYPSARLTCEYDETAPPSRPLHNRLGYDTVLSGYPESTSFKLGPGTRAGIETVLGGNGGDYAHRNYLPHPYLMRTVGCPTCAKENRYAKKAIKQNL